MENIIKNIYIFFNKRTKWKFWSQKYSNCAERDSLKDLRNSFELTEEGISKLKDRLGDIIQSENQGCKNQEEQN